MATLIIGAGLVGSQIARMLVEDGEHPVLFDRAPQRDALAEFVDPARATIIEADVLQPWSVAQAIRAHDVTAIVHMAANPMLTIGAQKEPYGSIQLNIMGTANVLEAARIMGVKRVVVASSNVLTHHIAGGEGRGDPANEEAYPRPISIYASCKQMIENMGLNYARWFGVDFVGLRYGAVAGPWGGAGGGGPSNVFRAMVQAAMKGEEALLPPAAMEWVYSKDAARGTVQALRAAGGLKRRIFNMTMGCLNGPDELAAALRSVFPDARTRLAQADAGASPALQPNTYASDLAAAKANLGYAPRYQMPEAVRDMAEWLKSKRR